MQLYSGRTAFAHNNDWQTTDPLCLSPATACGGVSQITATGRAPCQQNHGQSIAQLGCAQESALYVTLTSGGCTALVSGGGRKHRDWLVEVFDVSP